MKVKVIVRDHLCVGFRDMGDSCGTIIEKIGLIFKVREYLIRDTISGETLSVEPTMEKVLEFCKVNSLQIT